MSKKNKKSNYQQPTAQTAGISHQAEYRIIKFDLVKVLALNAIYLGVILALYYGNQRNHFLDNWFAKVLHF